MEIKATLNKPYTEQQRIDFIVEQNHKKGYLIEDTENALVAKGYTDEELAQQRQQSFYKQFIATSKGNFRLIPKGYANAQQAIDIIKNMVQIQGSLTEQLAQKVLFYPTPDFTKEEECTDIWLFSQQYSIDTMTLEEWNTFYLEFSQLYAQQQYIGAQ